MFIFEIYTIQYEFEKYRMEMSEGKKKVWCFNFFVSV